MFLSLIGLSCLQSQESLSIYGETKELTVTDKWAYFNINFGDFGHTVKVTADAGGQAATIYFEYGNNCPTVNSSVISDTTFFDHSSQNANIGVYTDASKVQVSVLSAVRPITINSSLALIYGFFVFFVGNILIASVLQYFFFKNSMDPREYLPHDDQ